MTNVNSGKGAAKHTAPFPFSLDLRYNVKAGDRMNYLKRSLGNAWDFLKGTQAYFRDVLLMHGFILFICLPLLSSTTRFILHRGSN